MHTQPENTSFTENKDTKSQPGYQAIPLSMNRRMMRATLDIARQQNNIQALIEVDISKPREMIRNHKEQTGERLSLTAYVVACLGRAIAHHPQLNSFRKGQKLIMLDDVTISVMVERELEGEQMPENLGVRCAQKKSLREIHKEIRAAQQHADDGLGGLEGMTWIRYIPGFLMRSFVRLASRNVSMMKRYGAVGVTAIGMFYSKNQALWAIPLVGGATVAVAIGGIVERPCLVDSQLESHEHLCLTVTFNHEIVDGAPAARFLKTFSEILKSGDLLLDEVKHE
jgi:pyruvate/2-oxoglutarate dehydrogenase complex dihydrolipoamide acyltransferase (E2) component